MTYPRRHCATAVLALVAAFGVFPAPVRAQASLAGSWSAEFPRRIQNVNGEERVTEMGRARLTLELRGDSVLGTWQTLPEANQSAPVSRALRGVIEAGRLRIVSDPFEATQRTMSGESTVRLSNSFELALEGDSLKGTMQTRGPDGAPVGSTRSFSAVREKR